MLRDEKPLGYLPKEKKRYGVTFRLFGAMSMASAMSRLVRTIDLIWARLTPVAAFNVSIARSREEIAYICSNFFSNVWLNSNF